ncbi:hypothetical protein HOG17_01195 [Candidatus Peregrinibacteria bacterium]|jgi:hypothetical protein|nr:hypothetical protein [Candidatus Peregrinibacteria bacterium]MBT4148726.1 hypothetical protein [Candidatus Peregrinibacteria bacterium]MBT4366217.1 hypothetical protein [Candidatus Peregrinibacteria bacterium]MBT4456275.1 hypothetical protein [Candidatus Peregrinibacteria bacterium]
MENARTKISTKRGETLIEVMAALTCLVLAGMSAVTVALQVMSTTAVSKEYLIAQNLAREGIEAVVNIRDTNWLNHPAEKDECWMIMASNGNCAVADKVKDEALGNEHYIMTREDNGQIILESNGVGKLEILDGQTPEAGSDGLFKLYVDESGLYSHDDGVDMMAPYPYPEFYRMITFEADPLVLDEMKINVLVQWMHKGSIPKRYELSSIITNYAN